MVVCLPFQLDSCAVHPYVYVGVDFVLFWSDDECVSEKKKRKHLSLVVLPMTTQTSSAKVRRDDA